jgi:hypothetical protein
VISALSRSSPAAGSAVVMQVMVPDIHSGRTPIQGKYEPAGM